jgi:hypothetical protein
MTPVTTLSPKKDLLGLALPTVAAEIRRLTGRLD